MTIREELERIAASKPDGPDGPFEAITCIENLQRDTAILAQAALQLGKLRPVEPIDWLNDWLNDDGANW